MQMLTQMDYTDAEGEAEALPDTDTDGEPEEPCDTEADR